MPTLQVDQGTLHYETAGRGPRVLLIHGSGVCGSGWEPQVEDLRKDFECLWFDNRGIGGSVDHSARLTIGQMARDTTALLDALGWETAHVISHSMGGLIAQQMAVDSPQRVKSLTLLCTFARGSEAARLTAKVLWMGLQTRIGSRASRRRAFLRMLFPSEFLEVEDIPRLADRVGGLVGRDLADSPAIMMKQLGAMRAHDISARLDELSHMRTLVVSAEHDPIALPQYGRGLAKRIRGSQYLEISGASHGVTIQMPDRVNSMLRDHLA